jgi:indolepyruvate ferredoxin oxidoreductase, alpha subunit
VRAALGLEPRPRQKPPEMPLPGRPPRLCDGCPHIDSYTIVRLIMDAFPETRVFSDIGCYTLGAYPPYNAAHSCIDMGASIGMAMGAAQAGMRPVVATIGDSTFMHSGMTPLAGAADQNLAMTVFILDNSTTAMTGGQPSMATGGRLLQVVKGLGVNPEHVHVLEAHRKHHEANLEIIKREVAYEGLSVIIPTRECVVTAKK